MKFTTTTQTTYVTDSYGNNVTDSSGEPIKTGEQEEPETTTEEEEEAEDPSLKLPKEMSLSKEGKDFLMEEEALSSLTKGKNNFKKNAGSLPDSTVIYSYQDSKGVWTIGYG
jgi:hypothetical protein